MSSAENVVDPMSSTSEQRTLTDDSDVECVRRCEGIISQYQRGEISRSGAVLALLDAPSIETGTGDSLSNSLGLYLKMLDEADRLGEQAHQ